MKEKVEHGEIWRLLKSLVECRSLSLSVVVGIEEYRPSILIGPVQSRNGSSVFGDKQKEWRRNNWTEPATGLKLYLPS